MSVPPRLTAYLRQTYPKPTIDPAWLDACISWIANELQLPSFDSDAQINDIISNVDTQLLNSDLRDSMLADTGLPRNIGTAEDTRLYGRTLVQIQGMTEIGHSAFNLRSVHQTRVDEIDLAGLAEGGEGNVNNNSGEDKDEGPIPKFPRSMLRFDLSDGSQSLRAIEFRRLPELELGVTPLGYKMILKDVPIRRGIAFLEPSNVELKGYLTEELEVNREADFARGLRMRLGQPEPDPKDIPVRENDNDVPAPSALPVATVRAARTPLREMSVEELNPSPPPRVIPQEELEPPTRRRVPAASLSSSSTIVSSYFSNTTGSSSSSAAASSTAASVRLSPLRRLPSSGLSRELNNEEDQFGEELDIDDAFFQELDAVERAALSTFQQRETQESNASTSQRAAPTIDYSEVIIIDSDSDDKENLAPVTQRRVRRRIAPPEDDDNSDIIVIE